jgi:Flp pilus assembly protein TadD
MTFQPEVADLLETGMAAHRQGDFAGAAQAYQAILRQTPGFAGVMQLLGVVRQAQGDLDEAERLIRAALAIKVDPVFFANLAVVLHARGRPEEAEAAYLEALERNPDFVDAQRNYSVLLKEQNRPEAALQRFDRVVELAPDDPGVHVERGIVLETLGREAEAEAAYRRCLALDPGHYGAGLNLALLTLGKGDFETGWGLYHGRHDQTGAGLSPALAPGCRPWRGESLEGRSLVVYGEQGFGDQIQFVRYAQMAKRAGAARVSVVVAPELVRLFERTPGLDGVVPLGHAQPVAADYWTWMLNLPGIFGTRAETIIESLPPDFPQFHLGLGTQAPDRPLGAPLEVGLFWAGRDWGTEGNLRQIDALRSLSFETVAPLLSAPELAGKVRWTVLQRDRRPEGLTALAADRGWRDPLDPGQPDAPRDFLDTARIMAGLDLVIGVDSALIHLAAALGRPTWMIDRVTHCWRWIGDGQTTDWYPTLRIFRQTTPRAWGPVIARIISVLSDLAARELTSPAP